MKGKIIWILYDNCLCCSEIREFCVGSPDKDHICIYLNPIIGTIELVITLANCFNTIYVRDAFAYTSHDFIGHKSIISFDFDKLCSLMNCEKEVKSS